jgi:hypothetical protein
MPVKIVPIYSARQCLMTADSLVEEIRKKKKVVDLVDYSGVDTGRSTQPDGQT